MNNKNFLQRRVTKKRIKIKLNKIHMKKEKPYHKTVKPKKRIYAKRKLNYIRERTEKASKIILFLAVTGFVLDIVQSLQ